jgi:hypothetical protein
MNAAQQKLLKQVTTYKYFISYAWEGGHGMCEMTLAQPIRGMDDVKGICKEIKRISNPKIQGEIVVLNWILL